MLLASGVSNVCYCYFVLVLIPSTDHPMVALETVCTSIAHSIVSNANLWTQTIDFTCVETQIGDGSIADCEIVDLNEKDGFPRIKLPGF